MNKSKQDLSKGIRSLLGNIDNDKPISKEKVVALQAKPMVLPIDQIEVNPYNPRVDFDETALRELADSIKTHGLVQPLTVRRLEPNKYQIIAGERRFRASQKAGLKEVPVFIRTANDQEMIEMALIENIQRENLNAIEIAFTYKRLMDECSLTQEKLSDRVGKERATVANYLRLLKLPPEIQKGIKEKKISMGHAKAIQSVEHIDKQLYVYKQTLEQHLSVRAVEELAKKVNDTDQSNSTKPKSAPTKALPTAYQEIQKQIQNKLSTKVELKRTNKGAGKIVIDFFNDDDLERLLEILS